MDLSPAMSRVLDVVNASQAEVNQFEIGQAVEKSQRHTSDTGSPEVQIAVLTTRITRLAAHLKENHKDRHSHRGLMGLVNQRRKMMKVHTHPQTLLYYPTVFHDELSTYEFLLAVPKEKGSYTLFHIVEGA